MGGGGIRRRRQRWWRRQKWRRWRRWQRRRRRRRRPQAINETRKSPMKSQSLQFNSGENFPDRLAITIGGVLQAATETKKEPAASQPKGKEFSTPKEAADALIQAAESFDVAALKEILGPGSDDIISSEDAVADKNPSHGLRRQSEGKNGSRNRSQEIRITPSLRLGTISSRCRFRSSKTETSGPSIPRLAAKKSSTVASARTNWMRLPFVGDMSKRRTHTRRRSTMTPRLINTRSASSARPENKMASRGKTQTGHGVAQSGKASRARSNEVTRKRPSHFTATISRC